MDKLQLIRLFRLPHMQRNSKIGECIRPSLRPGLRRFVCFVSAVAAIWAVLVLAPQEFAAAGAWKNAGAVVQILYAEDTGAAAGLDAGTAELLVLSSKLSPCFEHGEGFKDISGSCQTCCSAPGCGVSAILAWRSPALAVSSRRFVLFASNAPNSFLNRRLDRPPIDRSA